MDADVHTKPSGWILPGDMLHLNSHERLGDFNYRFSVALVPLLAGATARRVSMTYRLAVGDPILPGTLPLFERWFTRRF